MVRPSRRSAGRAGFPPTDGRLSARHGEPGGMPARGGAAPRWPSGRRMAGHAAVACCGLATVLLAACARFPEQQPTNWTDRQQPTAAQAPQPHIPGEDPGEGTGQPGQGDPNSGPPVRDGCKDTDPALIATCLDSVYSLAVLPGSNTLLAGERDTGRILRLEAGRPPLTISTLPVNAAGGGGLTGLAISPNYAEDQLIFAYISTPVDNRVVRLAPNDVPKPLVTGIPKGPTHNAGALEVDDHGALLAATGDAGNPATAGNPGSLGGKVLRIDTFGNPAPDNPNPGSPVFSAGLHAPGGLCATLGGGPTWVTDQAPEVDALYQVAGGPLANPAWSWPDRPGVTGCMAGPAGLVVAESKKASLFALQPTKDGGFTGKPTEANLERYGQLRAVAVDPAGGGWAGTINKEGGKPVSSDERVVHIQFPNNGGGGKD